MLVVCAHSSLLVASTDSASLKGPSSLAWDVPWDLTICPQLTRFYDVTCQSCIAADDWRCECMTVLPDSNRAQPAPPHTGGPRAEVQALGELIQERRLVSRSHVEYSGRTGAAWVALRNESVPEAAGTTPAARVVVGHLGRRLADLVARFTPLHAAFVRVVLGRIPAAAALDQSLKVRACDDASQGTSGRSHPRYR